MGRPTTKKKKTDSTTTVALSSPLGHQRVEITLTVDVTGAKTLEEAQDLVSQALWFVKTDKPAVLLSLKKRSIKK